MTAHHQIIDPVTRLEVPLPQEISTPELRVGIYRLTPDIARIWKKFVRNNRPIIPKTAYNYARDLITDHWWLVPDAIAFDENGDVVNGQHRIEACILANKPIDVIVIWGLKKEAFLAMDTGSRRTPAQIFNLTGHNGVNPINLSATGAFLWRFDNKSLWRGDQAPTVQDRLASIDQHSQREDCTVEDSVRFIGKVKDIKSFSGSVAVITGLHCLASEKHGRRKIDKFFEKVGPGAGLRLSDPEYHLRETLIRRKQEQAGTHLRQERVVSFWLSALNAYIRKDRWKKMELMELNKETLEIA